MLCIDFAELHLCVLVQVTKFVIINVSKISYCNYGGLLYA